MNQQRPIKPPPSWPFRLSVLQDGTVRVNKGPKRGTKPQRPRPGPDTEPALL